MSLAATYPDLAVFYERLAPNYDRLHRRWLRFAGGEAQAALEAAVRVSVSPQARLLDAGCGTGAFARRLIKEDVISPSNVTLMDPCAAMLARCADMPCAAALGRLEAVPFENGAFDIVTCAWALETSTHPTRAIDEMQRVLRPGGWLCLAFCANRPANGLAQRAIQQSLKLRGAGRFLGLHEVTAAIVATGTARVVSVPVTGPVAMVIAQRHG